MNSTDETVRLLAEQIYGNDGATVANREEMEATFVPMIRVAMRTGLGRRVLVEWVERNLPGIAPASRDTRSVDPESAVPHLARLLCSQMLRQFQARRTSAETYETVVGL